MFKIAAAITIALYVAKANSQKFEQSWQIQFPGVSKMDTIRILYQPNSMSDYTIFEYWANSQEPYCVSHYSFDPDSGFKWLENYRICDSITDLGFQSQCQVINSTPIKNIAFLALGNLGYGYSYVQCTQNKNCKQHAHNMIYSTNTYASSWGWIIDSASLLSKGDIYYRYKYMSGGKIYNGDGTGVMDSAIFLGDTVCVKFSYGTYGRSETNYFLPQFIPAIEGIRISQETTAARTANRFEIPNFSRTFSSVKDFNLWMLNLGKTSNEVIDILGQKSSNTPPVNKAIYVRHESRIYRVLIMGR